MYALELDGVSKSLGGVPVLVDVSLQAPSGTVLGLVGPNGAGKSTMLNIIAGLQFPDKGTVRICGYDVRSERPAAVAHMGYVSDSPFLYDHLTAIEFLTLMGRLRRLREVGSRVELMINSFRLPADQRLLREYSLGMRKKVALAAALLFDPSVVIMDEPFNALDYAGTVALQEEIHKLHESGKSCLLATHLMNLVTESCTHVSFVSNGRVAPPRSVVDILHIHGRLEAAFLAECGEG